MNLKLLYSSIIAVLLVTFIFSCDDNASTIGQGIHPDADDIIFEIDSVFIKAETTTLPQDYIYLENDRVLLGEINDDKLGKLKADFLAEYYCANAEFELGYDGEATIDSVQLQLLFTKSQFTGDTLSTMGVTVYELTKNLVPNFNTNVDPSKYCDMSTILGQRFFSFKDLSKLDLSKVGSYGTSSFLDLSIELNKQYGVDLYNAWKADKSILNNSENLKKILKGIYVTTNMGKKSIIEFESANSTVAALIFYSYKDKKVNLPEEDTIRTSYLGLPIGAEAVKLNRIINTPWDEVKGKLSNDYLANKSFIKTPSGIVTELTIPLGEIKRKGKDKLKSDNYSVNSALFKLTGMTEVEKDLSITKRPSYLLFIHQDSISKFFEEKKLSNGVSSLIMLRDTANVYKFALQNYAHPNVVSTNLSSLVNHYLEKAPEDTETLKFYVIPVAAAYNSNTSAITSIENILQPAAAIFRTEDKYMKMSLAFSKHNEVK